MIRRSLLGTFLSVLAVAILTACAGLFGNVASQGELFYTATPRILAGEDVGLRLVNRTDMSIYYNLCRADLQRRQDGGWTSIDLQRDCPQVQFRLAPTETAAYDLKTPLSLAAGTYRAVATITINQEETERVATPHFRVRREAGRTSGSRAE